MPLRRASFCLIPLVFLFSFCAFAQRNRGERPPAPTPAASPSEQAKPAGTPAAEAKKEPVEPAPTVTHHEIHVGGKTLHYTATTGMMPLKNNDTGEVEAHIFFIAYTLDGQNEHRPLTFSFNGGPGSASVWLHMGAIGPKRVRMQPDGMMPPPPYQLVDNEHTWLDQTDLVFIDPVGTGY
ncbi:MAG TPA: peptidase S10, partial [Candidatus Polarisedimenticolia bacterium]|nr:peptidase S10 [Candidatus Polarisedimenticolia bacterium]